MPHRFIKKSVLFFVLMFPLAVYSASVDEYIKDANTYIEKQDFKAAIIQLKNALQQDSTSKEARALLGQTYLKVGDILSAEKELRKAKRAGAAATEWMPYLADVYLAQNKIQEVIDELKIDDSMPRELRAEMLVRYGQAYFLKRDIAKSLSQYKKAININPNHVSALLGIAQVSLSSKDFKTTQTNTNKAIEVDPQNVRALTFAGEVSRVQGDYKKAVEAYKKALTVTPQYIPALGGLASSLVSLQEFDEANKTIGELLLINKNYPNAYYLKALISTQKKDFKSAENELQQVFRITEDHLMAILLMGRVQYQINNFEQAEKYLKQFYNKFPKHVPTVKLLASTRLKLRDYDGAKKLLTGIESSASNDPGVLSLLGMVYAQSGDVAKGTEYFERATKIAPEQAQFQAQLGVSHLAEGDIDEAIKNLESAVKLDATDSRADMMLILAHLRNKDFNSALKVARAYAEKDPENPITYNFIAAAYSGKKDYVKARRALEKALSIKSDFSAAEINLARIDLAENSPGEAEKRFKNVIRYDGKNVEAHMELAKLAISQNNKEEGLRWIKEIRSKLPTAVAPALVHIRFLLADKEPVKALDLAENMIAVHPENIELLNVYANAQVANQHWKEVLSTYEKLNQLLPKNADVLAKIGITQIKLDDKKAAKDSFDQALTFDSKNLGAMVALANLYAEEKSYKKALIYAKKLQKIEPRIALGWIVEGDIYNAQRQYEKAIKVYNKGKAKQKSNRDVVRKLVQTYQLTGSRDIAVNLLNDWLLVNEKDLGMRLMLAQVYQSQNKDNDAAIQYEIIIQQDSNNIVALNNVAWIYAEQSDKKGIVFGKRAYDLAPENPSIADTYGWALVRAGSERKGLVILQQASMKAPHVGDIKYHLAYAYHKLGKSNEAKTELTFLLNNTAEFGKRLEAEKLLAEIN